MIGGCNGKVTLCGRRDRSIFQSRRGRGVLWHAVAIFTTYIRQQLNFLYWKNAKKRNIIICSIRDWIAHAMIFVVAKNLSLNWFLGCHNDHFFHLLLFYECGLVRPIDNSWFISWTVVPPPFYDVPSFLSRSLMPQTITLDIIVAEYICWSVLYNLYKRYYSIIVQYQDMFYWCVYVIYAGGDTYVWTTMFVILSDFPGLWHQRPSWGTRYIV